MNNAKPSTYFLNRQVERIRAKRETAIAEYDKALDGIEYYRARIRLIREMHGYIASVFDCALRALINRFKLAIDRLRLRCQSLVDTFKYCSGSEGLLHV